MNHTKGPWTQVGWSIFGKDGSKVCTVSLNSEKGIRVTDRANTELIKAAPEMLEALEKVLPLLKAYENGPWEVARNMVIDVLKKVRGE